MRKPRKPLPLSTTPIARTSRLPRARKPPRPRKKDPPKRRFGKHRDPEWCAIIREMDCLLYVPGINPHDCSQFTECAHTKAKATGGKDRGETVPLCTHHHRQQHTLGMRSFQELYDIDLAEIAQRLAAEYGGRYTQQEGT